MAWTIEFDERALKDLGRLDRYVQKRIRDYLRQRIASGHDPQRFGKALRSKFSGLWRYRVGDYRILCRIEKARQIADPNTPSKCCPIHRASWDSLITPEIVYPSHARQRYSCWRQDSKYMSIR